VSSGALSVTEPGGPPDRIGTLAGTEDPGRQPISLVDLLDRLLGAGVVLSGDLVISIAGIDLVEVRLHALITSVRAGMRTVDPIEEATRHE
jgi:hypothetical protein